MFDIKFIIFILATLVLTSCNQDNLANTSKTLDLKLFTIETPRGWTLVGNENQFDSCKIAIDSTDTLEYKYHNGNFTELHMRSFISEEDMYQASLNNSYEDTINGRKVLVVRPKKTGDGITAIFIDSFYTANSNNNRIGLHGKNLKPNSEKAFLQAIKTIKFTK